MMMITKDILQIFSSPKMVSKYTTLQVTPKKKISGVRSGDLGGQPPTKDKTSLPRVQFVLLELYGFRVFFISLRKGVIINSQYRFLLMVTEKNWSDNSLSWHCETNTNFLLINIDSWKWWIFCRLMTNILTNRIVAKIKPRLVTERVISNTSIWSLFLRINHWTRRSTQRVFQNRLPAIH